MKLRITLIAILLIGFTGFANASSQKLSKSMQQDLVNVCEAIQSNKAMRIRLAIDKTGAGAREVLQGIRCNGLDALSFAKHNKAGISIAYLQSHLPKNATSMIAARP